MENRQYMLIDGGKHVVANLVIDMVVSRLVSGLMVSVVMK